MLEIDEEDTGSAKIAVKNVFDAENCKNGKRKGSRVLTNIENYIIVLL